MEKFGCLGLLVILLGLGIPISSVGYHPKYSERWGVEIYIDGGTKKTMNSYSSRSTRNS
jgi:hypothetical protein